jgi:two-component system sensor histidine kinase KdpD
LSMGAVKNAYPETGKYLVAISDSPSSEHVIKEAAKIAQRDNTDLIALYVEKSQKMLDQSYSRLRRHFSLALRLGAEIITTGESSIYRAILTIAEQNKVTHIFIGESRKGFFARLFGGKPVSELLQKNLKYKTSIIPDPANIKQKKKHFFPFIIYKFPFFEYGIAFLGTVLMTLLNFLLVPLVGYWSIALLYLLFVSFIALFIRVGPVILTATLSALLWNYLFIPPLNTFSIGRFEDLLMFVIYFVNALIIGGLTARLRLKEQILQRGEKRISALYNLSRELGNARSRDEIAFLAVKYMDEYLNAQAIIFLEEKPGRPKLIVHSASKIHISKEEYKAAIWAYENRKTSGLYTDNFPEIKIYFIPLLSRTVAVGVLGINLFERQALNLEEENFIQNAIYLISMAIDRDAYMKASQEAMLSAESERLYKVIFNLISHELRTPLTTITGASSSLCDQAVDIIPETRHALYSEIKKAGDRLNRLVENILNMSRIESGQLKLEKKQHDLHDLINIAIKNMGTELSGKKIIIDIPLELPPLSFDFNFMEQVIGNILHNASVYSRKDAEIIISAFSLDSEMIIVVKDGGPGLEKADIPNLFEKFKRGAKVAPGGIGLGLSICKGIVEAHGGKITASNSKDGGAEFRISLPLE